MPSLSKAPPCPTAQSTPRQRHRSSVLRLLASLPVDQCRKQPLVHDSPSSAILCPHLSDHEGGNSGERTETHRDMLVWMRRCNRIPSFLQARP